MNLAHYLEEVDFSNARADRFDGFDRGDLGRIEAQVAKTVIGRRTVGTRRVEIIMFESLTQFDAVYLVTVNGKSLSMFEARDEAVAAAREAVAVAVAR